MKNDVPFVVAIDGPAGAGKSTTAKKLAVTLGYAFLDTGAIYRAVALAAQRSGVSWADGVGLGALAADLKIRFVTDGEMNRLQLDGQDVTSAIRASEISDGASRVSALPEVRSALLGLQRKLGAQGRIVAEGRDVGTVVFPDARAKFFLTAPAHERARRRTAELHAAGRQADEATVLAEMQERDARDSNRSVAPLARAVDAVEIDSGGMTVEQVVVQMADMVKERGGG